MLLRGRCCMRCRRSQVTKLGLEGDMEIESDKVEIESRCEVGRTALLSRSYWWGSTRHTVRRISLVRRSME